MNHPVPRDSQNQSDERVCLIPCVDLAFTDVGNCHGFLTTVPQAGEERSLNTCSHTLPTADRGDVLLPTTAAHPLDEVIHGRARQRVGSVLVHPRREALLLPL